MLTPALEILQITNSKKSFNFFKVDANSFQPFWHYHPELELTFITKGQGTRFVGNSILPFYDYDLVLVGENLPHHWVTFKKEEASMQQAFVFQFPKEIFKGIYECESLDILFREAKLGLQFTKPSDEIVHLIRTFGTQDKIKQVSILMGILNDLQNNTQKKYLSTVKYELNSLKNIERTKVNETVSYILKNLHQKLTVRMLADYTHMVPQSFCRWFKKSVGNSFVTFVNRSRIEKACQMLLTTEIAVQQIAFDCGFESLSHFNRTFKSFKRKSPRDYKSDPNQNI